MDSDFGRLPIGVDKAYGVRASLRAHGADGWIDDLALEVMNAAPEGASAVRAKLATAFETVVTIPAGNKPLFGRLFWRYGCIHAALHVPAQLKWSGKELDLFGVSPPETVLQNLPGKPVHSVVEFPFHCAGIIERAQKVFDGT